MKRTLTKKIVLALAVGTLVMSSSVAMAAPNGWTSSDIGTILIPAVDNPNGIVDETGWFHEHLAGAANRTGDISGGKVTFKNGTQSGGNIYGGYAYGSAANNTVTIENGMLYDVYGGFSYSGDATNNTINITDGTVKGDNIYGGYAYTCGKKITGNTINITGGTIGDRTSVDVYAGYADGGTGEFLNNTISVSGSPDLTKANLHGTNAAGSVGSTVTNNTLKIGDYNGTKISMVKYFDTIEFEKVDWDTNAPALTVGTLYLDNNTGTKIVVDKVHVAGGDAALASGESMTLIDIEQYYIGKLAEDSSVTIFEGVATTYDGSIVLEDNDVKIKVADDPSDTPSVPPTDEPTDTPTVPPTDEPTDTPTVPPTDEPTDTPTVPPTEEDPNGGNSGSIPAGGKLNPQVLVIGESRTAATAFVNQGSELIETGLDALHRDQTADDVKVFAALYNGASKYETGSHIKVNGWSGIVGIGKTNDSGLTYGAFFESGEGNYRTYNHMDGMLMRGDGEANYNGGGLLIRKDHDKGFYAEASLRAGNLSNRLDGAVMGSDGLTGYDIDSFYYGAHIGIGKIIPKGKDSLDIYGKFLYTHHDSETFEIDGDEFRFDSMDSQRLRLGFRYNQAQTDKVGLYYGAAWEYEFGGDADNRVVGYELSTPSLEGSTVIGELGMHYLVSPRWSLDANVRGYVGQRDGWSGSVQANYSF